MADAIEKLRAMLDERGVEWKDGDAAYEIEWSTPDGRRCSAMYWKPTLSVLVSGCTPEQAIAATLGRPTFDANLEQALSFMRIWISDDAHLGESELSAAFEKAEGLRKLDAIESAMAATLGSELNPNGLPVGLTISEDGNLLNWRGENYVKQSTRGDGECEVIQSDNGPKAMNDAERAAMKALMRGVAILMRFASWQMLGKFDQRRDGGPKRRRKWALVLKDEASAMFREAGRL